MFFEPMFAKNDTKAGWLIGIFSVVIFVAIVTLGAIKIDFHPGFDVHIFAKFNAIVNTNFSGAGTLTAVSSSTGKVTPTRTFIKPPLAGTGKHWTNTRSGPAEVTSTGSRRCWTATCW